MRAKANMIPSIFRRLGAPSSFVRAATLRGLPVKVARLLEPAALELHPDRPEAVLESRGLLQRAALKALVGDGGNLELSFEHADALAATMDALQLSQVSDVPEPFRRVWIATGTSDRTSGVVLTCEQGELGVFCPPETKKIPEACSSATLSYRGFTSSVELELRLSDSCRFPGGLMLHLSRKRGGGDIGRRQERLEVHFQATLGPPEPAAEQTEREPCEVLDISTGGARVACAGPFQSGLQRILTLPLPGEPGPPLSTLSAICWSRQDDRGAWSAGLLFVDPGEAFTERLLHFLGRQKAAAPEG